MQETKSFKRCRSSLVQQSASSTACVSRLDFRLSLSVGRSLLGAVPWRRCPLVLRTPSESHADSISSTSYLVHWIRHGHGQSARPRRCVLHPHASRHGNPSLRTTGHDAAHDDDGGDYRAGCESFVHGKCCQRSSAVGLTSRCSMMQVGYSWSNAHLPTLGNPGIGYNLAWKRALLVIIGTLVDAERLSSRFSLTSFFPSTAPPPPSS
jgi:hypothetical protein